MNNVILHKDDNGNNVLTYVAKSADINEIQKNVGGVVIDKNSIEDIAYLNAYNISNGSVVLDLEKARELKVEIIRSARDEVFLDFDKRYDIAVKDEADLTKLKQERQKLKDAPLVAKELLENKKTLEEIIALTLETTIGV